MPHSQYIQSSIFIKEKKYLFNSIFPVWKPYNPIYTAGFIPVKLLRQILEAEFSFKIASSL